MPADGRAPHGIVVGESEVFDQAEYDAYRKLGGPTVVAHSGMLLYSGTRSEVLEGTRVWRRPVAIAFPSVEAAHTWHDSPEYTVAAVQRNRGARSSIWIVEQTGDTTAPARPAPGGPPLAYILGEVTAIRDTGPFKEYLERVAPSLAAVGARYLTRGGRIDLVEGPWQPERVVLIEFPNWEVAAAWYGSAAYQELARLRQGCSDTDLLLVEGAAPPATA